MKWPECVGMTGPEAKTLIEAEAPDLHVVIVDQNAIMTMDYRLDRVRVKVDGNNVVTPPGPMVG
eukprot:CAMPEP_0116836936 /NCGR_PEP_ID=MMETSP0418-20121206/8377_1 /TAXON_ID=1158023 /ORGANISM="Astrosyne radiata, Strain 13vi08-1A" /LENGTH=63 /DNA_ID=CAMNT_0004466769 /DNA_START=274 /DNA_END=465 /DNA_ORIENTATION=-